MEQLTLTRKELYDHYKIKEDRFCIKTNIIA